jgi:8-oxo-dGTP pyrophosphatase MutT (NUDIX family)|tara:strand:+ start:831 stop:1214 length:384 start_codon:yes stop_codon:yes gene_type:complete
MKRAAGTLLICELTNRILLVKRSDTVGSFENTWATVGGGIDHLEKPLDAAKRELWEETKIESDNIDFVFFEKQNLSNTDYYFFIGWVDEEVGCDLNDENTDWGWFDIDNLPDPLIPTLYTSLQRIFT